MTQGLTSSTSAVSRVSHAFNQDFTTHVYGREFKPLLVDQQLMDKLDVFHLGASRLRMLRKYGRV